MASVKEFEDLKAEIKKSAISSVKQAIASYVDELGYEVADKDDFGIIADGKYYCLGDPSDTMSLFRQETTEHEIVADGGDETIVVGGKSYRIAF